MISITLLFNEARLSSKSPSRTLSYSSFYGWKRQEVLVLCLFPRLTARLTVSAHHETRLL